MMTVEEIDIKLGELQRELAVRDKRIWLYGEGGNKFWYVPNGDRPCIEGRAFWMFGERNVFWPSEAPVPYKGITEIREGVLASPFSMDVTGKQDFFELERAAKQAWGLLYERITGQGSRAPVQ